MERLTLYVPAMYADHHVLRVRQILSELEGVANIVASSAAKRVILEYDPTHISPLDIERTLSDAGYPPNQDLPLPKLPNHPEDGSAWYSLIQRVTETERKDLEMAGDFRRY